MNSQGTQKVFVGVSGGVDSSVALALLRDAGYDVTGVFLKVWNPDWLPCNWREERRSAMRVCATLGVPFMTLDCEKEYKEKIVDYMISEYRAGRTPNPDVFCNKEIKFGVFLDKAREAGADFVATGHYAQISDSLIPTSAEQPVRDGLSRQALSRRRAPRVSAEVVSAESLTFQLLESTDKEKDQSYFLYQLNQNQLAHALFPIGHLHKNEVRELAKTYHLPTAEKKDSQGLCFIGKVDMKDFLSHYIHDKPGLPRQNGVTVGDVVNEKGEVIGRHDGAVFYTIGERHGLHIFADKKTSDDSRLFVIAKDMEKNTITVAPNSPTPSVGIKNIKLTNVNWISGQEPDLSKMYGIRFRYRQEKQNCKIEKEDEKYYLIPEQEQTIAAGQSAVIYDTCPNDEAGWEVCLGGGIIA